MTSSPDASDKTTPAAGAEVGVSLGRYAWRRLRKNRAAMASLGFLGALTALAVLTPLLPLQPPNAVDTENAYRPPNFGRATIDKNRVEAQFNFAPRKEGFSLNRALVDARLALFGEFAVPSLCGTDQLGRDMLARLFWGARLSLLVGLVATLVSLAIGVTYGAVSGYVGGWLDNLMMRFVDVLYSIPFIFVVIFIITIVTADGVREVLDGIGVGRIVVFFFLVGAIYWLTMARVVRGQVLSLRNELYVEAARALGATWPRVIARHVAPNLLSVVIVYLTLTIPNVMLFEAFISFLGLGVQAPDVSWGLLANEGFKVITPVKVYWWLVLFPGLALALTLFSLNFLGDGLRDALDPRLQRR